MTPKRRKISFFKSIFSHLCFFPLREKALCLLLLLISCSLSLSLGWTNVEAREHLNTLAQWWTQAKGWCALGAERPISSSSLALSLTHTFSKLQCVHTLSRTPITETHQNHFKMTAQNNKPQKTKWSPNNDIKNKTMRPYTIIISAWGQREAGETGCVNVQCHNMLSSMLTCSQCVNNKRKKK